MTKKNKSKIEARTRQATLGGKYQHHLRAVGGGGSSGRFECYVMRIIELAKARHEEVRAEETSGGDDALIIEGLMAPRPAAEAALRAALHDASPLDARKLEVLMYVGRDAWHGPGESKDVFHLVEKALVRDAYEITLHVIGGKSPLHVYLTNGLAEAKRVGLDLKSAFARPVESEPSEPPPPAPGETTPSMTRLEGVRFKVKNLRGALKAKVKARASHDVRVALRDRLPDLSKIRKMVRSLNKRGAERANGQ
jgi:hypothetical protein